MRFLSSGESDGVLLGMVRQEDIERSARHLLNMQVSCPDSAGMAMLRRFVADCKAAMVVEKARSTSDSIELPDRYIEVDCPCGCDHIFEIDLKDWTH